MGGVGSPHRRTRRIGRPSRSAGMGLDTLEEGREGLGVSSRDVAGVGRAGRDWESLSEGQED